MKKRQEYVGFKIFKRSYSGCLIQTKILVQYTTIVQWQ